MSRQSILTKYLGPTDTRGSRVKAVQSGWHGDRNNASVTLQWDDSLDSDANHAAAAKALAVKLGWKGSFISASLGSLSDFAYCFAWDDGEAFSTED